MCGIVGLWGGERPGETVLAMVPEVAHRGPDAWGAWTDERAGLALGHRRLSILDLSEAGIQPMRSPCGRWSIVYNGEIYNYRALRAEMPGETFRGGSDTEVILRACALWGVERAVSRFNGMFAFALWDSVEHELWLVRDRLGIKPLYWGRVGGRFAFGSELRALRPVLAGKGRVDAAALALYLRYGYVPGTACIYEGVSKLAPGHILRVRRDGSGFRTDDREYWTIFDHVASSPKSERDAREELEALLLDAVKLRLISDVPLGAFLSGGIDSSTVVALMRELGPVKTYSIGFHEERFDEAKHARRVAEHLGTDHHEEYVSAQQALAVVPELGDLYSEPFADPSQIPTTLVSRLARKHVTVVLSGDGGDELFGGYSHYRVLDRVWGLARRVPLRGAAGESMRAIARSVRTANGRTGAIASSPRLRRRIVQAELLGGFLSGSARSIEALYEGFLDHWRGEGIVRGAPNVPIDPVVRGTNDPRLTMMLRDLLVYLPDDILTKVDRASMSCGLEARVPLLDYRVVELVFSLPLSLRVKDGQTKWLLRQILYDRVPRALIERPKMGFSIPLAEWLRGPLRPWAESLLSRERLRSDGYFDAAAVHRYWREHTSGVQDWSTQMWDVLQFQAWLDAERRTAAVPVRASAAAAP